jgi:hypothetical protein
MRQFCIKIIAFGALRCLTAERARSQDLRADLPDLQPGDKFGAYRSFEQGRADPVISLHAAKQAAALPKWGVCRPFAPQSRKSLALSFAAF